jgi:hypothetical protein
VRGNEQEPRESGPIEPTEPGRSSTTPDRSERRTAVRSLADALGRLVPFVEWLARVALRIAILALAGGAVIWWAIRDEVGSGEGRIVSLVLWAVVLAAPPAMLFLVHVGLRVLGRLPDRLRELPDRTRGQAAEVRRLAGEAGRIRQRGKIRSLISVLRLAWRVGEAREMLDLAAPLAFLSAPWALAASFLALVAGLGEIVVGAALLVSRAAA